MELLDSDACIDLGRKPGCDRHHLLYWSLRDNAARVALRDRHTGTVVTVLPLDYHATLAWSVSEEEIAMAKRRAVQRDTGKGHLRLRAHYLDDTGDLKTKTIWQSIHLAETPADSASIVKVSGGVRALVTHLSARGPGRKNAIDNRKTLPPERQHVACGIEDVGVAPVDSEPSNRCRVPSATSHPFSPRVASGWSCAHSSMWMRSGSIARRYSSSPRCPLVMMP